MNHLMIFSELVQLGYGQSCLINVF